MPRPTISMELIKQLADMVNNPDCSVDDMIDVIVADYGDWSREQAATFLANLLSKLNT